MYTDLENFIKRQQSLLQDKIDKRIENHNNLTQSIIKTNVDKETLILFMLN